MVENREGQDMVEKPCASRSQCFNGLVPSWVLGSLGLLQAQPADRVGMGALTALCNHNVAPFLPILAQESGKKPPHTRSPLSPPQERLSPTLCLTDRLMAR